MFCHRKAFEPIYLLLSTSHISSSVPSPGPAAFINFEFHTISIDTFTPKVCFLLAVALHSFHAKQLVSIWASSLNFLHPAREPCWHGHSMLHECFIFFLLCATIQFSVTFLETLRASQVFALLPPPVLSSTALAGQKQHSCELNPLPTRFSILTLLYVVICSVAWHYCPFFIIGVNSAGYVHNASHFSMNFNVMT